LRRISGQDEVRAEIALFPALIGELQFTDRGRRLALGGVALQRASSAWYGRRALEKSAVAPQRLAPQTARLGVRLPAWSLRSILPRL
jgi:hypothetical protein